MDENLPLLTNCIAIAGLIFLNGFFAAAEFALIHSNPGKLRSSDGKSQRGSKTALWLQERLDMSITAAQLGTTTASLLLGWIGVRTAYSVLNEIFQSMELSIDLNVAYVLSILGALLLVSIAHVVFGELVAKSIALRTPETCLRVLSGPFAAFTQVCRPVVFVTSKLANGVLTLFGSSLPSSLEPLHSISELSMLVTQGTEQGVFDEDEQQMLRGVFGFSDTVAREVMTPRTDLVPIDINASLQEVIVLIEESGFSRFPVKGNGIDDIMGILLAKDLLPYLLDSENTSAEDFHVKDFLREAYFIPETKPIDDLLNEFKRRKLHMAIVLDEHGGVDGLVTLEDLIEELVGDIFDESDTGEQAIVEQDNGEVVAEGGILVTDLNSRFDLEIPEGEYDTIAGYIFTSLGRMPQVGDQVSVSVRDHESETSENNNGNGNGDTQNTGDQDRSEQDASILVETVENNRIESIRIILPQSYQETEPAPIDPASEPIESGTE